MHDNQHEPIVPCRLTAMPKSNCSVAGSPSFLKQASAQSLSFTPGQIDRKSRVHSDRDVTPTECKVQLFEDHWMAGCIIVRRQPRKEEIMCHEIGGGQTGGTKEDMLRGR